MPEPWNDNGPDNTPNLRMTKEQWEQAWKYEAAHRAPPTSTQLLSHYLFLGFGILAFLLGLAMAGHLAFDSYHTGGWVIVWSAVAGFGALVTATAWYTRP